jgi:molecular chaperone DnaK
MIERACEAVGIDLGTTYSSMAYLDTNLIPQMMMDTSGKSVVPSVVLFDDGEILVGDIALKQSALAPDRVVQFVKVHMGEDWRCEFQGHTYTPESLSAIILAHLVQEAEKQNLGQIRSAVITVPAYFNEKRRRATQQAGEIAGLKVLGTLNEPMAATLAYGLHGEQKDQNVVVYDLGGGTFDVTVVHISPLEIVELATSGNRQLGGKDWDQVLIDHVAADFRKTHGLDLRADPQGLQNLLLACEDAKRQLSVRKLARIPSTALGKSHLTEVPRPLFEELTVDLLHSTKITTEIALEDAKLSWAQIDRIVLVGGSTLMPAVPAMLERVSGKKPEFGVNPVLAVALGAAVYAHLLESDRGLKLVERSRTQIRFVTAHGVGVRVRDDSGTGWKNSVLIHKNSPVPATASKRFYTAEETSEQTVIKVEVTQGDSEDPELAEVLGEVSIDGFPSNEPSGQPVDVTMEFDQAGRLQMRAIYANMGREVSMALEVAGGLRQEEVQIQHEHLKKVGFLTDISTPL